MGDSGAKKNKRIAQTLSSQGFRKPYQVVVDSSFARTMNKVQNGIAKIQNMLRDHTKFYIPKCEYEKHKPHMIEKDTTGQCEIIRCNHDAESIDCLEALIKKDNKHHYLLATCDSNTIKKFKDLKNVPIVRIRNGQVIIELGDMERIKKVDKGVAATKKELESLRRLFGSDEEK